MCTLVIHICTHDMKKKKKLWGKSILVHILYIHLNTWYEKRLHLCKRILHICTHDIKKVIFLWGKCLCTLINTFVHMIWEKVFFLWGMSMFVHIFYTHFYTWYEKRSSFYEVCLYLCTSCIHIFTHDMQKGLLSMRYIIVH